MNQIYIFSDNVLQESEYIHRISNHPVHIQDKDGLSPSSFIPICEFGGEMKIMGDDIDEFDVPVCNSFKAKILNDQLCYEVDLNDYKDFFTNENLKKGLKFLVDENRDRFFSWSNRIQAKSNIDKLMVKFNKMMII